MKNKAQKRIKNIAPMDG